MTLPLKSVPAAEAATKIPIGFQLYTVRSEFARDVPGTLKKLSQIGYGGVEFWGYAGTAKVYQQYTAPELRKMLEDCSLKCCGMHLDLEAFSADNLQRTIESNQVLGSRFLNIAAAEEQMHTERGIAELAALLNETAAKVRPLGLAVGYHAHPFDFRKIGDRFAWELLFSRTRPEVNMQMDVGNTLVGHGDPLAMLKEFPGRTKTIHIKEHEDKTFDSAYYREIFELCETSGTQWSIVEMGGPDGEGFEIPRRALEKLRQLGK